MNKLKNKYSWLEDVYHLTSINNPSDAIDILYTHMDDYLLAGNFAACNEILSLIDINKLDSYLIVSVLSITVRASSRLKERIEFLEKAKNYLKQEVPDSWESLLKGLE